VESTHAEKVKPAHVLPEGASAEHADTAGTARERLLYLQRHAGNGAVAQLVSSDRDVVERATGNGGSPLAAETRAKMEQFHGADFSSVRVHTDATATAQLKADAFTVGERVVFAPGRYDEPTLAHELTHVVQQRSGSVDGTDTGGGVKVSDPADRFEREAYANGAAFAAGGSASVQRQASGDAKSTAAVQRQGTESHQCSPGCGHAVVQRHASWEHALLGNVGPKQLAGAIGSSSVAQENRKHVLEGFLEQLVHFQKTPHMNPPSDHSGVQWINLSGSGLWVSYGELNALADYLPGPTKIDQANQNLIGPVLQRMRYQMVGMIADALGISRPKVEISWWPDTTDFKDMATSGVSWVSEAGGEVIAMDNATKSLKTDSYKSLLSRNACHFAPDSWQRWLLFHNEARAYAKESFQKEKGARGSRAPLGAPNESTAIRRLALLQNGYGDHFLEDSFAAGHLVNKTLVMQWFVDWITAKGRAYRYGVNGKTGEEFRRFPSLPSEEVLGSMGSQERDLGGSRTQYRIDNPKTSVPTTRASQDARSGVNATDPETAEHRGSLPGKIAGSGVTRTGTATGDEKRFQIYLDFLDSTVLQMITGAAHDHFNATGLLVKNTRGDAMHVGGDDTMLSKSTALGMKVAAEAAEMSRNAVYGLLDTGATTISPDAIFDLVPTKIVTDGTARSLEGWNDDVLKAYCASTLFPNYWDGVFTKSSIAGFSPTTTDGKISQEQH
jgi:hypothetical protein